MDLSQPATNSWKKPDWLLEQQDVTNGVNHDLNAILKVLSRADVEWEDATLVGSKYTADPKMADDTDVLLLVRSKELAHMQLVHAFEDAKVGGSENEHQPDCWLSVKIGKLNVLVTEEEGFYKQFKLAAEVCRYLQEQDKGKRVAIHMILMDGFKADELRVVKGEQWI